MGTDACPIDQSSHNPLYLVMTSQNKAIAIILNKKHSVQSEFHRLFIINYLTLVSSGICQSSSTGMTPSSRSLPCLVTFEVLAWHYIFWLLLVGRHREVF